MSSSIGRGLSDYFKSQLKDGVLNELLEFVKRDNTLDLEIRENYINIYYRGGNILRVICKNDKVFEFFFDESYGDKKENLRAPLIPDKSVCPNLNTFISQAKQIMDFYFTKHPKEEREFQQLVVRENNYSTIANGTDYFIIDIEYDNHKGARFDLVAVEWPSNASNRKLSADFKPTLTVFEMKYGDGAIKGESGIRKHENDFNEFLGSGAAGDFKMEMLQVLRQKRELGLIPKLGEGNNTNEITEFAEDIKMVYLFANHDPESTLLINELETIKLSDSKIILANFFGYALFNTSLIKVGEFVKMFSVE